MFCLQSHYRKPLEFSYDVMDQVKAAYEKLRRRVSSLAADGAVDEAVFAQYRTQFEDALANDINTASAITVLYDVLKAETNDATKKALAKSFDEVLGLDLTEPLPQREESADSELAAWVAEMIGKRAEAKKAKDFAAADAIREELAARGVQIKDTREGVVWELTK